MTGLSNEEVVKSREKYGNKNEYYNYVHSVIEQYEEANALSL